MHRKENEMNDIIKRKWKESQRRLPGFNCITYPNGTITILNAFRYMDSETGKTSTIKIYPLCDTTIDSIIKYEDDPWTLVDQWCTILNRNGHFIGGDGQMGNEGFVAHMDGNDNLIWAIFFTVTNPIKSLNIVGNYLICQNEHDDMRIEINLKDITDIKCILKD